MGAGCCRRGGGQEAGGVGGAPIERVWIPKYHEQTMTNTWKYKFLHVEVLLYDKGYKVIKKII